MTNNIGYYPYNNTGQRAPECWNNNHVMRVALKPCPFEQLYQQREYHLHHLHLENERVMSLYHQLVVYDDVMLQAVGIERKEARRGQKWIKKRIAESLDEERAILFRLSELHIEIQSRERWYWIWNQRVDTNTWGCSRWSREPNWLETPERSTDAAQPEFPLGRSAPTGVYKTRFSSWYCVWRALKE